MGDVTSHRSLKRKTNFCSPSIEKCANFLRTHSLISFAEVSIAGIRLSKASFFEWSDTRKYSTYHFRGSSFMYTFMSTEIKTILIALVSKSLPCHNVEIIPCCQQQHCFSASSRQLLCCFFFSFYNLKILQLFKIKCLLCHHECISVLMNHPCIEYYVNTVPVEARHADMLLMSAPYMMLT